MAEKHKRARVLVLGGTGFIGRNFVNFLVKNDLASKIRVADRVPPPMAWLTPKHKEAFDSPLVQFKHSNLVNAESTANVFTDPEGEFDYVINAAAQTKFGQTEAVYKEGIVKLSVNCATQAARRKVQCYVEISSGQMYSADKLDVADDFVNPESFPYSGRLRRAIAEVSKVMFDSNFVKPHKESSKVDPWTHVARHKLFVERELESIPDLNYVVLRPAYTYGLGDRLNLTPRLMIGAVYKYLREPMKMLWTKDLKMNTVHIDDLCRAIWHVCIHGKRGEIYNVVDNGDSTQGRISELISEIFEIEHEFLGSTMSNMAKFSMKNVVEDINDKHMEPWSDACIKDNISNTPLNPFIDQELLYNRHVYLDGSKLESTGFTCEKTHIKKEFLKEILDDYISMNLFPTCLLSGEAFTSKYEQDLQDGEKSD